MADSSGAQRSEGGRRASLLGVRIDDVYGRAIGVVVEVLGDRRTGAPSWLAVSAGPGEPPALLPHADATGGGDYMWVPFERRTVAEAPSPAPGEPLTPERERALSDHYVAARGGLAGSLPPPPPRSVGGYTHRLGHRRRLD